MRQRCWGGRLALRHRLAAYLLFALGAAAKFYPVALFILALREPPRRLVWLAAAAGLAGALALALEGHAMLAALRELPSGTPFRASFGRIDVPRGLAMLHIMPRGMAAGVSWGGAGLAAALAWRRRIAWEAALAALDAPAGIFMVAGAAITAFCFLAAQNIEYRAIFLLLMLPGLARLRRRFPLLMPVILLLLWEAVPRAALAGLTQPYLPGPAVIAFWLLREALWWGLVVECLAVTLAFVTAPAVNWCEEKLTPDDKTLR